MAQQASSVPTWLVSADIPMSARRKALEISPEAIKELEVCELLGKGRFKHVHRGNFRGKDVVVLNYTNPQEQDLNEIRMLTVLAEALGSARYVPEVHGICMGPESTVVLQERAAWGSLKSALKDSNVSSRLTGMHLSKASYQLAAAMAFLQRLRIVHADLSCRNVLVCKLVDDPVDISVRVSDFGLALFLEEGRDSVCHKQPQATRWCAPETVANMILSHRADVWSYATTVWEMFAGGSMPWIKLERRLDVGVRLKRLANKAKIGAGVPSASGRKPDDFADDFPRAEVCPEFVHRQILACLQVDEMKRPSFSDIADALKEYLNIEDEELDSEETFTVEDQERVPQAEPEAQPPDEESAPEIKELEAPAHGRLTPSTGTPVSSCSLLIDISHTPPRPYDRFCDELSHRIKALEEFLWSDKAIEALGEEAVFEMRMEVEAARARDMFLSDRKKRQALGRCKANEDSAPHEFAQPQLAVQREAREPASCCQESCETFWSLWSFSSGALHQQRYASDHEAWAAFYSLRSIGNPCVLRDPLGAELAALSWVTMPARLLTPLRLELRA